MKKIVAFIFTVLIFQASFGQIQIGMAGGVNVSSLSTDLQQYKQAAQLGLKAGVFARMGGKLYLQPELFISSRSAGIAYNLEATNQSKKVNQNFTFRTLDIPVLIGLKIIKFPLTDVRLNAGPVLSVVTKKQFDIVVDDVKTEPDNEFNKSFRNLFSGLQFGAGLDVAFLTVDVRYELGLNNIYNQSDNTASNGYNEVKSNQFFICLGFKLFRL